MLSDTSFFRAVSAAVCLCGLAAVPARAMERVTLRSGLTVDCTRHENLGDQVRLYTGRGKAYEDVSFLQIVAIDYVPDAVAKPKPIMLPQPIVAAKAPVPAKAPTMVPAMAAAPKPVPLVAVSTPAPLYAKPAPLYGTPKPVAPAFTAAVTALQPAFPEMEVHDLLLRAGSTYNIDAELLASIIHAESGGNARATSRYGARGLMQLMPSVGRTYGASDLYRPEQNVTAGTAFLDALLRRYNDNLALALAAYNAGPGAVERYHGVPPLTRGYVSRVMAEFYRRKLALGAKPGVAAPVQVAVLNPVKPIAVGFSAPGPTANAAPVGGTRRGRSSSSSSIHQAWSGQRSFPRRGHSSYSGF